MTQLRVIGVGSPLGDDQVGWRVAHELMVSGLLNGVKADVSVYVCDRPGSRLITYLEGADAVVLVDAMRSEGTPGKIHRFEGTEAFENDALASSHGFGVATALDLARAMGLGPRKVVVYAIELGHVDPGREMSDAVVKAVAVAVKQIADELWQLNARLHAAAPVAERMAPQHLH